MKKETVILITVAAGILLVGGGLYLYFKKPKEKPDLPPGVKPENATSAQKANTSGASASSYPSTPFTSSAEGNAFRLWVNNNYPDYAKSIQLDPSGDYDNSYIRKAYQQYGSQYQASQTASTAMPTDINSAQAVLLNPNSTDAQIVAANQILNAQDALNAYGQS